MLCFINIIMFAAIYSNPALRASHPMGERACQIDLAPRRGLFIQHDKPQTALSSRAANTKAEYNWSTTDMANHGSTLSTGIHRAWIAVAIRHSLTTPTT
jgi:hypothetical protein